MNKLNFAVLFATTQLGCLATSSDVPEEHENALLASPEAQATLRAEISARGVDCGAFVGYTAKLGTLTVDCLGTIAPDAYKVNADGRLARNFTRCTLDETRLVKIDQTLSLQRREAQLPHVKECFAGAYADFVRDFATSDVTACPTWKKQKTVNPITPGVIDSLAPRLDFSVLRMRPTRMPDELEVKHLYHASFAEPTTQKEPVGAVAARCAAGFAGFVITSMGDSVLTDPPAWLLDTQYESESQDPYMRPGYYHPMSWYPAPPGQAFADYARFSPCVPGAGFCNPELCTYYAGGLHKATKLQKDCLDPNDESTCNAYCGPLIIK